MHKTVHSAKVEDRSFDLTKYILLILIGAAIFLLPYARVIYYDELLGYLKLAPLQLGGVLAIYGTTSTVGTFLSGVLADRYSAKWLLVISLLVTGLGGFILLSQPGYYSFMGLYILWGLSITLTYNSAHYKAVRYAGSAKHQGKLFGSVGGLRFLVSGGIAMIAATIYSSYASTSTEQGFVGVVWFYIAVYLCIALAVILFWKKDAPINVEERWSPRDAIAVFRHPATWYIGLIIYGVYAMARCLDLIAPYMRDIMQIEPGINAYINTFRVYFCTFAAGISLGVLLDRTTTHKILACQISTAIAAVLFLAMAFIPAYGFFWQIMFALALCGGVIGQFGAYITAFSLLEGANVPKRITGSIIGVSISIGFLPDIIINYLSNYLAEIYGIGPGCHYLLLIGAAHGLFAIAIYSMFSRYLKGLNAIS